MRVVEGCYVERFTLSLLKSEAIVVVLLGMLSHPRAAPWDKTKSVRNYFPKLVNLNGFLSDPISSHSSNEYDDISSSILESSKVLLGFLRLKVLNGIIEFEVMSHSMALRSPLSSMSWYLKLKLINFKYHINLLKLIYNNKVDSSFSFKISCCELNNINIKIHLFLFTQLQETAAYVRTCF